MTGIFFNGRQVITPAAVSAVNDDALLPQGADVGNYVALIGQSTGGVPNTILTFGSPEEAIAALVSGDLLDAAVRAFNPSSETGAPFEVICVRVNPAVQSSLLLKDASAATVITLTSTDYGLRQNQVKAKVEAATGGRGLKLTTQLGTAYYSDDNIFRNAFTIQYGGGQASAVMTVSQSQVVLQAPSGTTVATIDLATFPTIQQLVDRINAVPSFTAAVADGNGDLAALNALDTVTAQDVKTALFTAPADLQAAVDWFNNSGEPFVTAARAASVGTLPAAIAFTYLSGGSDGTVTNTQWTNGFTTLQSADFQWLTPCSNDPNIHAMADAHVAYMSSVGRKERRSICGTPLATSDATALTLAKAINSDRTSLVHIGGYDYDIVGNGALKLYQPFIVAAMIAGAFAGLNPGTPMTGKSLKLRGVERNLRNPTDTDALLLGGILPIENTKTGFRVVQSISTWLTNAKYNRREQSVGNALDYAVRFIRERVEAACKGKKGLPVINSLALSTMETACIELAKPEEQGGVAVLAGDKANPPYKNLTATLTGDTIALGGQLSPVLPINYMTVNINAVPFSGSVSIS